jgi:hypothetical protein
MKKYQVRVKLSYYAWVEVDAVDEESAQDQAVRKAWRAQANGEGYWGEEPSVLEIQEGEVT